MIHNQHFDLIVLGGGPGGYASAIRAGQLGMSVALIEREKVGGTCLHHGCIPSKVLLRHAEILEMIRHAEQFGIQVDNLRADFGHAIDRSQQVIQKLTQGLSFLMKKNRVTVFPGQGIFITPNQIEVTTGEETGVLEGRDVIISVGSRVKGLPHLTPDGKRILTSDDALLCRDLPPSIAIIGGGAVGVEFAYLYSVYGVAVSIVEMAPSLLPSEDREVALLLEKSFKKRGIDIMSGVSIESLQDNGQAFLLRLQGVNTPVIERKVDRLLLAVGRMPNTEGIGLSHIGLVSDEKTNRIVVNERMETHIPHLYAIGDVTTRPALAHGAMAQGVYVVESLAGRDRTPIDLMMVPNAIFCSPQVASVGLTEEAAREMGREVKVGKFPLSANSRAIAMGETEGFVKIISDPTTQSIWGAHLIGHDVTELVGEFVIAKKLGATARDLKESIHPHPTLSEAVMEAGGAILNEAIHY